MTGRRLVRSRPARSRCAAAGCCAALAFAAALIPARALAGQPTPSQRQVAASRAEVASIEAQVSRTAAQLGRARSRLARLNTTAEVAFEAFDGAQVKLQAAQGAATTAAGVLSSANHLVAKGQRKVAEFARAAYETGGLSAIDALLSPGGAGSIPERMGDLEVISNAQQDTLQRVTAAQVYRQAVSQQADAVAAKAKAAAQAATRAKAAAQRAVSQQQTLLAAMRSKREHLASLLTEARAHASALQRERIAALARERAAAAAAASAPAPTGGPSPYAGSSSSLSGTISAATGEAAVQVAEQQIGKPYVWGGAGPDSFDCSGLVMWSYDQVGVHLDHYTGDQWQEGARVSTSALRPGDLVFFATNTSDPSTIHHVGMYVGNGEMVEAPHTGAYVRYSSIWRPDLIGAVRPYAQ